MNDDEIAPAPELPPRPEPEAGYPEPLTRAALPEGRTGGRLLGKVALVSGGDRPLARAVAIAFAHEGADVALLYVDAHEEAQETMRLVVEAGCETMALTGDVGLSSFCDDAVAEVMKRFGRIDIVINAAAEGHDQPDFERIGDSQIERTFRTNIFGQMFLCRAALPHLRAGAAIVNTSSVTAFQGHPSLIDEAASQGAVVGFTRALALALATRGIRVNAVAPGPVTATEAVAPSYVFLAGPDARAMTGQVLHPDGGTIVSD